MTVGRRDHGWHFRVEAHSDALVTEAATLVGVSKTAFVQASAAMGARSLITERQPVTLTPEAPSVLSRPPMRHLPPFLDLSVSSRSRVGSR